MYLAEVVKNIADTTDEDHTVYFAISDQHSARVLNDLGQNYMWDADDLSQRYVSRMNKLIKQISEDEVFFGSDDVVFHADWLTRARAVMDEGYPVVVVNDLSNPNGTQALMRTDNLVEACFDDPSAAFHHGYQHNFADSEQFTTARLQGKLARAMDSVVAHLHPGGHKTFFENPHDLRPTDGTYTNAMVHWHQDAALFNQRMRQLQVKYG
jgi:hypothetical protein